MSWARTVVSTGMSSRPARERAAHRTATPVTNIASVESMNGAPRIAPTPIPWDAAEPPPDRIAMIGIIVSGSAVPTAASTDPTAPSASSSFRPNHSMPFVNSSAPIRMTTKATARTRRSTSGPEGAGEQHAEGDDREDQRRDCRHHPIVPAGVSKERGQDPSGGRGDHDHEAEPDEAFGSKRDDVRHDVR